MLFPPYYLKLYLNYQCFLSIDKTQKEFKNNVVQLS